ncbi:MAG: ATP-grasp domain-containing protein [Planctomycetaceae bacterium]|nr:ATP-grasp domain-containing protein [Planctomycetaceae bacterium]
MVNAATITANLLIIGASTRAAAHSAIRAGFKPLCLDMFGDADLQAVVPTQVIEDYPNGLLTVLPQVPRLPAIYVGGLETRPDILECLEENHELWGNSAEFVRAVRCPDTIQESIRMSRVHFPEYRPLTDRPPQDGTWLIRPRSGTGGFAIQRWTDSTNITALVPEDYLFQKVIEGEACSATFLASGQPGDVRFVGVSQQLLAGPDSHLSEFRWCGNLAPISLSMGAESLIRRFGNVLKWKMGLRGLYGVDFVVDAEDRVWITDINPRYPASCELLEHITGCPLLADHARCFDEELDIASKWSRRHPHQFLAKGILFAPREGVIKQELRDPRSVPVKELPEFADLPMKWTEFQRGDPVCTVFSSGDTRDATLAALRAKMDEITTQVFGD